MLRTFLASALCVMTSLTTANFVRAAITQEGGVFISPELVQVGRYTQSTAGPPLGGDGKLWITAPSTLTSSTLNIGSPPEAITPAAGSVYVQGGSISHSEGIYVGRGGNGRLEVSDGGSAVTSALRIGGDQNSSLPLASQGVAIIDGVGSTVRYGQDLTVGYRSSGQLYVSGGGLLSSQSLTAQTLASIGRDPFGSGLVVVDGAGSLWQHGGDIAVGQSGAGTLRVTDGGVAISTGGRVGGGLARGAVVIDGAGSRWSVGSLALGTQGYLSAGEIVVTNGGTLEGGRTDGAKTVIGQDGFGRVVLSGSTSRWLGAGTPQLGSTSGGLGEIVLENGAQFTSVGISLLNGRVVVDGPTTRWMPQGQFAFGNSQLGPVTIELINGGSLHLPGGVPLDIRPNGRLLLAGGRVISPQGRSSQSNSGLIQGSGVLQGPLGNNGRIVVGDEEKLQVLGQISNGANGVVEVNGGELEVSQFSGTAGSRLIARNATLRGLAANATGGPWNGRGTFTFAGGLNRVFGAYSNATTVVASGAEVEFYDGALTFSGNILSVAAGGKMTTYGPLSGRGVSGGGAVYLENLVLPNNLDTGVMAFGGDMFLGGASRFVVQVSGLSGALRNSSLSVEGSASLSGTLQLTATSELPTPTALLPIVRAGEISGVFSSIPAIGANIGAGVRFHGVTYDYVNDEVLVSLTQGLPADFDLDGQVSGSDFLMWQRALGTSCEPGVGADATRDGFVDRADLAVWQAATAAASGGLSASQNGAQTAVPEPASLGLLGLAVVGLIGRFHSVGRLSGFGRRRFLGS